MTDHPASDAAEKIGDLAADAGVRRVHVLAWRDLDDVEAGGSERHADEVCSRWAAAGIDVTMRTSFAQDHPPETTRNGYEVVRRAGRYLVFPRAVAAELAGRHGRRDALVEIWNGMPFLSPLWARGPRLTFLHHVHGRMWHMVLPPRLAAAGDLLERRVAPLVYRRSRIVTLSNSSKAEIVADLGLRADRVDVVPPGVDASFVPGGSRTAHPSVMAVGRLVPSKHVDELVRACSSARQHVPGLRLVVVGEGYERHNVQAAIDEVDGSSWVDLRGHIEPDELLRLYQESWVLASASSHEGWGMAITEAAACGTPAVVTDIAGHRDAVGPGAGVLAAPERLAAALADVLGDPAGRADMGEAARRHAAGLTWGETATRLMTILAEQARTTGPR